MSEKNIENGGEPVVDDTHSPHDAGPIQRPEGWKYKGFRVFGKEIWYASPSSQLLMVSMVCFLCPGMFNALGGMGGMGLTDISAAAKANTALYSAFAVVAFFAGTITNVLGVRMTLAFGGIGYTVYIASFFSYAHNENIGFVYFAGAFLGLCAGMLWTAQGAIMMSYPEEHNKGRYISWFWMIFNLGAVIGSLVRSDMLSRVRTLPTNPPPRSPSARTSKTSTPTSTTALTPPSSYSPSSVPCSLSS